VLPYLVFGALAGVTAGFVILFFDFDFTVTVTIAAIIGGLLAGAVGGRRTGGLAT
jgi:hypothetical protein